MRQRPSLFNYGTAFVARHRNLLCTKIDAAPAVFQRNNPLITVEPALPVFGTDPVIGLNYCFQITKAEIDFHPGNIVLPPELNPPLGEQHFSLHTQVCGGLGCPKEGFDNIPPPEGHERGVVLPTNKLECFCLDLFIVGHVEVTGVGNRRFLLGKLDGLEIVDVKPDGLESSLECYLNALIQLVILPQTKLEISKFLFQILDLATITFVPTPISPVVPHNPAIEDNQLKVFVNFEVSP